MADCTPRITATCETKELQAALKTPDCPNWEICLPFGGKLYSLNGCVKHVPSETLPPDGIYSRIKIIDGCIVSAELAEIPVYTPASCAPIPNPCDCEGGSGTAPEPSNLAGNLFEYDTLGRPLVRVRAVGGNGVAVTGSGTALDPFVITCTLEVSGIVAIKSGSSAIIVTGAGSETNPVTITHATGLETSVGGMRFDAYGHLAAYTEPPAGATDVKGILSGEGIKVDTNTATGIYTISLEDPNPNITGEYTFGGYEVTLFKNRITNIVKSINITGGTHRLGNKLVTINEFGSIETVEDAPPSAEGALTSISKRFTGSEQETRSVVFALGINSSFRISYNSINTLPADIDITIDGVSIPYDKMNSTLLRALTPTIYATGTHTISVHSNAGLSGVGYIDVDLTSVY